MDLRGATRWLDSAELLRVQRRLANRLDSDGRVRVVASEHREQSRNVETALVRMELLLARALRPAKRRVATKPSASARLRRVDNKRKHGKLKGDRSRVGRQSDDW